MFFSWKLYIFDEGYIFAVFNYVFLKKKLKKMNNIYWNDHALVVRLLIYFSLSFFKAQKELLDYWDIKLKKSTFEKDGL